MSIGAGAAVGGIASGIGGLFSSNAANQASQQQQQMGMLALLDQQQARAQAQANLAPYMNIGAGAFGQLGGLYGIGGPSSGAPSAGGGGGNGGASPLTAAANPNGNYAAFYNSPDYGFALQQGEQAVDRSAAARGTIQSGGLLKELTNFGQGLASQQFGNYFNRLLSLSQIGANAASGNATNMLNSSNSLASTLGNIGQARAAGTVGGANALTGALGNIGLYSMLGMGNNPLSSYLPSS